MFSVGQGWFEVVSVIVSGLSRKDNRDRLLMSVTGTEWVMLAHMPYTYPPIYVFYYTPRGIIHPLDVSFFSPLGVFRPVSAPEKLGPVLPWKCC